MLHTLCTHTHTHTYPHLAQAEPLGLLPAPRGAWHQCGGPHSASLYHQHCLQLKKHISSCDICCADRYVTVTAGYVMAILLSCSSTWCSSRLWSINTGTICTYPWPQGSRAQPQHTATHAALPRRAGASFPAWRSPGQHHPWVPAAQGHVLVPLPTIHVSGCP